MQRQIFSGGKNLVQLSNKYDLVLILEYFRSATAYLSVIKALSAEFSIGIYQVPLSSSDADKHKKAQSEFLHSCELLGAQIIMSGPIEALVLLVPQRPLSQSVIADIQSKFDAKSTVVLLGFAYPGIKNQDEVFKHFEFKKAYAIDNQFIQFLVEKRNASAIYDKLNIVEVGLPFRKYSICGGFTADYILAMPTQFSFPYEYDKWLFLETVLHLFGDIGKDDIIVHKPHNGSEYDQFSSTRMRVLLGALRYIPKYEYLLKAIVPYIPIKKIRRFIEKLYTAHLYEKVLTRTITMDEAGGDSYLAMEAYLPGVNKGVIGGTSNTMWGTLYYELKFFNCVDILNQKRDGKDKLYGNKNPDQYLDLNLQYFLVPYCHGVKEFDETLWSIPSDGSRSGDLIKELRCEILEVREQS